MNTLLNNLCQNHAFFLLNKNEDELKKLYSPISFKEEGLVFDSFIEKELSHDFNFNTVDIKEYNITYQILMNKDEKLRKLFNNSAFDLNVDFIIFYQLEIFGKVIYNQVLPIKQMSDEKFLISSFQTEYEYQTGHKFKVSHKKANQLKESQEKLSQYCFSNNQYLFVAVLLKNDDELSLMLPRMNFYGHTFSEKRKEGLAKYNTYNFEQKYELLFENKFIASSFQQLGTKPVKQPLFIKKLNQQLNEKDIEKVNHFILESLPKYENEVVFIPSLMGLPFCFHIEFKDGDVWSYDNDSQDYEKIISSGIKVDKEIEQIYVLDCIDNCFILTFNE
jgi:hypothetical protein